MRQDIELLAPAGDYKSFVGAINAGANAVYISGKQFGARKFANNFTKEEIKEMIEYAHIRNVLVFVTINTLIFEDELDSLLLYADFLVKHKVDALIIQDLGIIELFTKRYPNTEIHASTQMNTYNIEQLKYLKKIGVSRAILARETSVDTIKKMKEAVDIDIETFVHGALCVSYSGNCLLSYKQGGRSGNRGECAQPCRLKYSLIKESKDNRKDTTLVTNQAYLLSTKDLMTLNNLEEILKSGTKSLKIEGRMKKPEYVVATIRAYREAIDHFLDNEPFNLEKRLEEVKSVFNREYTKGYILNEFRHLINNSYRPNHQGTKVAEVLSYNKGKTTIKVLNDLSLHDGIRIISKTDIGGKVDRILKNGEKVTKATKGDIVTIDLMKEVFKGDIVRKTQDRSLEDSLSPYLSETYKLIKLSGSISFHINEPIKLTIHTPFSKPITLESTYIITEARNKPQSKEQLYNQFNKLGNTIYYLEDFTVNADELGFIPNSVLNDLRRQAIETLEQSVINQYQGTVKVVNLSLNSKPSLTKSIIVKVETEEQLRAALDCNVVDIYYTEQLHSPLITTDMYKLQNRIWNNPSLYKQNTIIRDFGGLQLNSQNIITDTTLNVTNHLTLASLFNNGVKRVSLSIENTDKNVKNIIKNFYKQYEHYPNIEYTVYGKTEVMLTKYCPITTHEGVNKVDCGLCEKNNYYLVDESKEKYRIIRDGDCNVRIFDKKADSLFRKIGYLKQLNITNYRLDFTDETYEKTKEVIIDFINNTK